jgi:hypothetical protein
VVTAWEATMDTRHHLLFAACLLPTLVVATAAIVSFVTPEPGVTLVQMATAPEYAEVVDLP